MKQLQSDIVLVEGDNELNVEMVPIPPPAEFVIDNVTASPSSVTVKEPVTISFRITNVGGQSGNYYVCEKAYVNGEFIVGVPGYECTEWHEGTLAPGKSKTFSHPVYPQVAGTYTIYINEHVVSFEATEAPPPTFDPWSYDLNGNGYIDTNEMLAAVNDYYAGKITKSELDKVTYLWQNNIYRWA